MIETSKELVLTLWQDLHESLENYYPWDEEALQIQSQIDLLQTLFPDTLGDDTKRYRVRVTLEDGPCDSHPGVFVKSYDTLEEAQKAAKKAKETL